MNQPQIPNEGLAGGRELLIEARRLHTDGKSAKAESVLKQILATSPNELHALLLLGIIESESGRHQLAMIHLTQAVSLDPNNAVGYAILGKCLAKQGLHHDAIKQFQLSLELNPQAYDGLYALAESLLAMRFERRAAMVLRQAVHAAPNVQGLLLLGDIELASGRIEDAQMFCQMAIDKEPNLAPAHLLMGRILTERQKFKEAEEHWSRARELKVEPGSVHLTRAYSLGTIGQFEKALDALSSSIEANPNQGAAYKALVYSKRIGSADLPLVQEMQGLLSQDSLPAAERVQLLYAVGKSYDNLGDYERAILFFDQANSLRHQIRTSPTFNWAVIDSVIDASKRLFTKDNFRDWRHVGLSSLLPTLVVGMMRSGTTLVEQMLTCHPKVGGAGEQHYWGENETSIVDHVELKVDFSRLLKCAHEYLEVLTSISPGFEHVVDKNPSNFMHLGSMHLAFPNMRIIHTRRDPVDTALSIWMTPMSPRAPFAGDRDDIVRGYKAYLRAMDHWREVLPADRFLEIQYEDLVADPEVHCKRILDFCGLEWNEACIHPELNNRRIKTPSFWQARQPIYKSSTKRWKNYEPWLGPFEELQGLG